MRESTRKFHGPGYPGPVERLYRWPRAHPWLLDTTLAALLLAVNANAYVRQTAVIPVSAMLAAAVVVRRRFPVTALAVTLAIGTAQVIAGIGPAFTDSPLQPTFADAGILVLLYTVAANRSRQLSLAGLAACVLLFTGAVARWNPGPLLAHRSVEFVVVFTTYGLMPVCAWVLGISMAHRRAYLAALEERAVRAEAERDAQAQVAAAAERARIAHELHDVIAHNLSVMVAQADGGSYAFDAEPERSRQALAQIGDTGRQALAEMSHLLGVLKAGEEAPAFAPAPGVADITALVAQAREAGTSVSYAVEGAARPVPAGISLALYRIVQEALTNVRKHAGPGAVAAVTLRYGPGEALVRIADDGGAPPVAASLPRYDAATLVIQKETTGHGLAGMRDRVRMYGGTLEAGPCADGGFAVAAVVPVAGGPA
jgi:signal transduction histidine kinase